MAGFEVLASPAPDVEPAVAECAIGSSEPLNVEPAKPVQDVTVDQAPTVEPAVPFDDPKKFAPPMTQEEASHLSVVALRRGTGADFESKAGVIKGGVERNALRRYLPCIYDERDFVSMGEIQRFVFVKGNCIFVYGQETDPSPLYAIQLESVTAIPEDPQHPDKHSYTVSPRVNTNEARENLKTVLLKDRNTGKQAYQITFDTTNDKSLSKRFLEVLHHNSRYYGVGEVVTASVIKGNDIDKTKYKN